MLENLPLNLKRIPSFDIPKKIDFDTKPTTNDPVSEFLVLLQHPTVQALFEKMVKSVVDKRIKESYNEPEFRQNVDYALLDSESKILPRLKDVEIVTGLNALYLEDEDHEPTIPERIEALEQRTVLAPEKPAEEKTEENPIIANTTLTQKASALKEYLKKKTKANWSGKVVLENQDIYKFFREIIEEDLRWPEKMRGYRGAKKSIIERAQELYPDEVEVVRNKSGNKITGLALKPSVKRTDTNAC
jgi:hypothetical protein